MAISQSSCGTRANVRDLFIATAAKQIPRRDWCVSTVSKFKVSNTNLKIFSLMLYDTPARHLRNDIWKRPNLNQNGVFNTSSWYKLHILRAQDLTMSDCLRHLKFMMCHYIYIIVHHISGSLSMRWAGVSAIYMLYDTCRRICVCYCVSPYKHMDFVVLRCAWFGGFGHHEMNSSMVLRVCSLQIGQ